MSYLEYYENEYPRFTLELTDGATDQYPQASVYNYDASLKETVDLAHVSDGQYAFTSTLSYETGDYSVKYIVYSDSGHTTENTDYWRAQENLHIIYRQAGSFGGGGGGNFTIDLKKFADAVWNHEKAKKLIKMVEALNPKIWGEKIYNAVKSIIIPDPVVEVTTQQVDIQPVLDSINNIFIPDVPNYNTQFNQLISLLNNVQAKDYSKEFNVLRSYLIDLSTKKMIDTPKIDLTEINAQFNKLESLLNLLDQENKKLYSKLINDLKRELT